MPKGIYKRTKRHCIALSSALKGRKLSKEHIEKLKHRNLREKSAWWKGGRRETKGGYIQIYFPNHPNAIASGYILEHRLIMACYLKRPLKKQEVVHHINGNKKDNRIENLILFPNTKAHQDFIHLGESKYICKYCKKDQRG